MYAFIETFYAELRWNIPYFWQFCTLPGGTKLFHAWKFHVKVLYSSTSESASFEKPGSCGGHPVTTQDASCINLSIAKEQFKGKLTVVPIKNPDDHEMLKIIIQVLKDYTTELNFSGM